MSITELIKHLKLDFQDIDDIIYINDREIIIVPKKTYDAKQFRNLPTSVKINISELTGKNIIEMTEVYTIIPRRYTIQVILDKSDRILKRIDYRTGKITYIERLSR